MSVSGDSSGGMHVIPKLMPSTNYSIKVAAETSVGIGPYTDAIYQLTAGVSSINILLHVIIAINHSWSSLGR